MIKDEEAIDVIMEAKRLGHKFIKVILHRNMIQRSQNEIVISGVTILREFKKGLGTGGIPEYSFKVQGGENLVFSFSREDREFVAFMFDDQEKGYFSPKGYNRDVLASHLDDDMFVIHDEAVLEDVKARNKWMKENPGAKNMPETEAIIRPAVNSEDDIDKEIQRLKDMKEKMKGAGKIASLSEVSEKDEKDAIVEDAISKARKKKSEQQRKYREKKKLKEELEVARLKAEAKKADKDKEKELINA